MRTLTLVATLALIVPASTHAQVSCQTIGNQQYCSNGLSSQTIGNNTYYSNGVTRQGVGNFDYYTAPPPVYRAPPPVIQQPTPYQRYR